MTPRHAQAAALTALAQPPSPAPAFGDLGAWLAYHTDTAIGTAAVHVAERALAPRTTKPNRRAGVSALALLGFAGYWATRKAGGR